MKLYSWLPTQFYAYQLVQQVKYTTTRESSLEPTYQLYQFLPLNFFITALVTYLLQYCRASFTIYTNMLASNMGIYFSLQRTSFRRKAGNNFFTSI